LQCIVQIRNRTRPRRIQRCDSPVLDTSIQFADNTTQILVRQQPEHRQTLADRLPTINEVNREQVELLRRFRGADTEEERERYKQPLLLSINTIAAGLGATG